MTRRGFTLLEVLVASALLAMLVSILTMIFNQSSIAWSTGTAAVAGLGDVRQSVALYRNEAENTILSDGAGNARPLLVTSVWADDGSGLRDSPRTLTSEFVTTEPDVADLADPGANSAGVETVSGADARGRQTYIVGVTSWGPDGEPGTWDDISTLPEEVVK